MAKTLSLVNPDRLFQALPFKPVILNDFDLSTKLNQETLENLILTTYGKDEVTLNSVPTCGCGYLANSTFVGMTCPKCNQTVDYDYTRPIESNLWIRAPEGIHGMFTPIVWEMLSSALTVKQQGSWSGIEYLCNTNYRAPEPTNSQAIRLKNQIDDMGLRRGLNETIEDFDRVIDLIDKRLRGRNTHKEYITFFHRYRNELTCKYLPIPNKIAFVIEKTAMGDYSDSSLRHAREAIFKVIELRDESDLRRIGNKLTQVSVNLADYYTHILKEILASKSGWFRSSIYGSRVAFSFRTTITSRTDRHHYEELTIPYSEGCVLFRVHLINRLMNKHGYSEKDAYDYIIKHSAKIDSFLWDELHQLVKETPNGEGFWVTFTRYPTLAYGSTQLFRITGFSRNSSEISVLAIAAPNADFDGDQMSGCLIPSGVEREMVENLRPHYGIHNPASPGKLNKNIQLPDATVGTIHNWIEEEDYEIEGRGSNLAA